MRLVESHMRWAHRIGPHECMPAGWFRCAVTRPAASADALRALGVPLIAASCPTISSWPMARICRGRDARRPVRRTLPASSAGWRLRSKRAAAASIWPCKKISIGHRAARCAPAGCRAAGRSSPSAPRKPARARRRRANPSTAPERLELEHVDLILMPWSRAGRLVGARQAPEERAREGRARLRGSGPARTSRPADPESKSA